MFEGQAAGAASVARVMLTVRFVVVSLLSVAFSQNLECDTRIQHLEAELSSARASLFELRSALGQLTSSPKQAIDVDGSAQQRQLTASSLGEIKWDGTQFVMTADLKVNGTITADTCACGAR